MTTRSKKLALIVDDNEVNRELAADLLLIAGYEIIEAATGEDAVELCRRHLPDIVLMDMILPQVDGLEATMMLKVDETTRHIPVLALTAHAMNGAEEMARAAGCCGFIAKPIDTRRFATIVDETIANVPILELVLEAVSQ